MDPFSWGLVVAMAVFIALYIVAVVWVERSDRRRVPGRAGLRGRTRAAGRPSRDSGVHCLHSSLVVSPVIIADGGGAVVANVEAAAAMDRLFGS